jgi:signal transduction histidine kinase
VTVEGPITLAELRSVDLFDDLDDVALQDWVAVARPATAAPGDVIAEQHQEPPGLMLLLEGSARALLVDQEAPEPVSLNLAPTWIGAVPILTRRPIPVRIQAESPCRLGIVDSDEFRRLVFAHPAVHQRVMDQVAPVLNRLVSLEHNRSRLTSLGTMAAGLAHELNNPAAAARRAASDMVEAIDGVGAALERFVEAGIEREQAEELLVLQRAALAHAAAAGPLDALDAADAEDALLDRLDAMGVADGWRIAEPLASAGADADWLEQVQAIAGPATDAALRWVAASVSARRLAADLMEATGRISELVGAVKRYAYMDRGELVEVDLHEGLETTLAVLGHKLKHTSIEVRRDYDRALKPIMVRGSELNQVWTNLLDNAIDALDGQGTITIATRADGTCAVVLISDDGPGLAPDVADRAFDPFFTTKPAGAGTGLGLSTARQIVVDRHDGALRARSEPGRTTFEVRLPARHAKPDAG